MLKSVRLYMRIDYLCDNKQYIDTVVNWIYNEFIDGIRPGITYGMVKQSFENRKKGLIPTAVIALENNSCLGVASLVLNDLKVMDYSPWLAGLYVDKANRNRGVGRALIERVEEIAKALGADTLYLRTETASEYYRGLGWEYVESVIDEFELETEVYRKQLTIDK